MFEQVKKIFLSESLRIICFYPKICLKLSKIWVWDPKSGIRKKTYSGSRIQGQKGTGSRSATLVPVLAALKPDLDLGLSFWGLEFPFLSVSCHSSSVFWIAYGNFHEKNKNECAWNWFRFGAAGSWSAGTVCLSGSGKMNAEPTRSEFGSTTMVPVPTVSYFFTLIFCYIIFNFYFRNLTNEEEVCSVFCVSKHISYNNKLKHLF